ncbi:MAG: TetR/AcrR family transcriptional regulator [Ilumatobacter sp.]|uniref:TetR/AcrR family transcriptional regulator n=1 Tax=Ilumatobacter sp. TaxID=1967498 RepID=UPI003296C3BD
MSDGWERRQERTRRDVLDATGALISESGVDGLTMRKLAERAGVAVATLYNQFGDRDGVLVAFVSSGLDQLELELDAQPDAGPIDTTRQLFEALDEKFAAEPEVWRPIFASLKSGSGGHGMGEVGDRVVATIEADFEKAAADGRFVADVDVVALARHAFITRMNRLEKWATDDIDWTAYRASSTLGLELILAAVLGGPHRDDALRRSGAINSD